MDLTKLPFSLLQASSYILGQLSPIGQLEMYSWSFLMLALILWMVQKKMVSLEQMVIIRLVARPLLLGLVDDHLSRSL